MNQTKLDILLTLSELAYYCPYSFAKTMGYTFLDSAFKFQDMTTKYYQLYLLLEPEMKDVIIPNKK